MISKVDLSNYFFFDNVIESTNNMRPEIKIILLSSQSNYDNTLYIILAWTSESVNVVTLHENIIEQLIKVIYLRNKYDLTAFEEMIILSE